MIPAALGGEDASAADVADVCYILGRACASTAMIFAMHQVKVACLVRHGAGNAWQRDLQRRIAERQLLLASSTTEGANGGDIRSSEAAIQTNGATHRARARRLGHLLWRACRRHRHDRAARRERGELRPGARRLPEATTTRWSATQSWDTLGMRGTCSAGFILRAQGEADQVLPEPYERIHAQTMAPLAHLFWSSAWSGVAAGAVQRARAFVRKAARAAGGRLPPGAAHLTRARVTLETLRGAVQSGACATSSGTRPIRQSLDGDRRAARAELPQGRGLRARASAIVMSAMRACGLSGYRNDGEFAMGRYLRDILSAPIMINNDRILADARAAVLMSDAVPSEPGRMTTTATMTIAPQDIRPSRRRLRKRCSRRLFRPDGRRRRLWPHRRL